MKEILVKEIMTENLITLHPKNKISEAKEIFRKYNIHHIPVAINSKLVGILSLGDILAKENKTHDRMLAVENLENISMLSVDEVMTSNPISISSTKKLEHAIEILNSMSINCLPVEDEGSLVGILTSRDILKTILQKIKD